jgi:hypothetical protein
MIPGGFLASSGLNLCYLCVFLQVSGCPPMIAYRVLRLVGIMSLVVVSLSISASAGTFKNPTLIETSYDPVGTATADLNQDGNLDLIYVDGKATSTLHVLLGDGDGTFTHGQDLPLPQNACGYLTCVLNLADVTNDGKVDALIGASGTSMVQIIALAGRGDGTFQSPIVSTLTNIPGGSVTTNSVIGVGDLNGDGRADLAIPAGFLYIAFGDNTGKFSLKNSLTFYFNGPTTAYVLDLNADGRQDVVVSEGVGATSHVLLGKGDGTFQPDMSYLSFALILADMDGDGHPDLVASVYPSQIEILRGNPDGTFATPTVVVTVPSTAFLISIGDFNGDGIRDLVFLTPTGIGIVLATGNLTYGSLISSVAGTSGAVFYGGGDVTQGDFNHDGQMDIAMGVDGGIVVLLGHGDGTFASADWYDVGYTVGTVAVADFNSDKVADIAVTVPATYPRLLLGQHSGTFTLAPDQNQIYGQMAASTSMAVGDFSGDGKKDLDILEVTNSYPHGQSLVFPGAGNAMFASPQYIPAGPSVVADLNGDGRSDLVFTFVGLTAMLGQSDGSFVEVDTPLRNASGGVAAVGDVNRDGKPDLLVFEYPILRLWLGKGDGSFTQSNLVGDPNLGVFSQSIAIVDLDGDGNGDVVLAPDNSLTNPAAATIFYGNGDGTFQNAVFLPASHQYLQMVVVDVNQDNKPDLVFTDGKGIAVVSNLGARVFDHEEHYVAGEGITGLSVADVNGDGFPDIVAADGSGTVVSVLLNQPNGIVLEGAPSDGALTVSPEPSVYGQTISLSIAMSAPPGSGTGTPTGSVTFNVDGSFVATVSLAKGKGATNYSTPLLTGTHTIVATYNGDATYRPESFSVLHTVLPPVYATQTVVGASPKIVFTSQTVRFTATVTSAVPVPAGTVVFLDGTATLGSRQVDASGVALLDTALLAAGNHTITAEFLGYQDPYNLHAVFQPSSSTPTTVTVNSIATSTTISASNQNPISGTVVTFGTGVTSSPGVPFGGATFFDGTVPLGTVALKADGTATFSTAALTVGTHKISCAFNPNASFGGSTSPVLGITVSSAPGDLARTIVSLTTTLDPAASNLLLVAKVHSLEGSPAGMVTFLDGGDILGNSETDSSGAAMIRVPLSAGAYHFSASFGGGAVSAPQASPALQEQWPASGPGFYINLGGDALQVRDTASQPFGITLIPAGAAFQQVIQMSCSDGLPAGYTCSFSPATLDGGGRTNLTLVNSAEHSRNLYRSLGWLEPALGILVFSLVGTVSRRKTAYLAIIVAVIGMTLVGIGCGNSSPRQRSQLQVLSIQATSGVGSNLIVHSAQVELNLASER